MYNDIMDAVTRRLHGLFGEGYEIYQDPVEQGLEGPCFFVQFSELSERPVIGRRHFRETSMCIQYFPEDTGQRTVDLNRMAGILMDEMGYITLADGTKVRGTKTSFRISDGVLLFFVNYNMFVVAAPLDEELMESAGISAVLGDP